MSLRYTLLTLLAVLGLGLAAFAQDVGINLGNPQAGLVFVDIVKDTRGFQKLEKGPDNRFVLADTDGVGWPAEDFALVAFDLQNNRGRSVDPNPPRLDVTGVYRGRFRGLAEQIRMNASPSDVFDVAYDAATNTTTFSVDFQDRDSAPGQPIFTIKFVGTQRRPQAPLGSGITDLEIVRPGYELGTDQTFTDVWLDYIEPFGTLRYMDWSQTNSNGVFTNPDERQGPVEVDWADRTEVALPTEPTTIRGSLAPLRGLAWETIAEHITVTGKDAWINVPIHASDDYIRGLARLMLANIPADVTLYVEYSNEVWNYSFPQWTWNFQKSQQELASGNSNLDYDGNTNENMIAARRYARRTVEVGQIFSEEGFGPVGGRLRPVLVYFASAPGSLAAGSPFLATKAMVEYIEANYGPPSQYIAAVSRTGYFGAKELAELPEGATVAEILAAAEAGIPDDLTEFGELTEQYGLDFYVYEGAPGHRVDNENNLENRIRAERTQEMAELLKTTIIDGFFPNSGDLYMFFATHKFYDKSGFWGASDIVTDKTRGFKYQALLDVINGTNLDPRPLIGAGSLPPATRNVAYDFEVDVYGGDAPLTLTALTALPPGLALDGRSLKGVPTATGVYDVSIRATDADGDSAERVLRIQVGQSVDVANLASAPSIDGDVDGVWSSLNALPVDSRIRGDAPSATDLSAGLKVGYTDDHLYFLVEVTDEALVTDSGDLFQDDGVEIYLDLGNDKGSTYDNDDYQLIFRYGDGASSVANGSPIPNLDHAFSATATGYTFEAEIPWGDLGISPIAGDLLGFDVHVTDDDDGGDRDAKLAYAASSDNSYRNPSLFGTGLFVAGSGGGGADPTESETIVRIRNRKTGEYLRGPSGNSDLTTGEDDGTDAFAWARVPLGGGDFLLRNLATERAIQPRGTANGSFVHSAPASADGGEAVTWTTEAVPDGGGAVYLIAEFGDKHVRPNGATDTRVVLRPRAWRGSWTQWYLEAGESVAERDLVTVTHVSLDLALTTSGNAAGDQVVVAADDGSDAFLWERIPTAGGNFYLENVATGLNIQPDEPEPYALVSNSAAAGTSAEWVAQPRDDGQVRLVNAATGSPLTPVSGSDRATRIVPSGWNGAFTRWRFTPVTVGSRSPSTGTARAIGHGGDLVAFPNPTSGVLEVRADGVAGDRFTVVNLSGQAVIEGALPTDGSFTVDMSVLPRGVYSLRAGEATIRVVKR